MDNILHKLTEKKRKLDILRPLPSELVKNLDEWFTVELTYTSNAIEGNTLSRQETALVVEKGITVEGKSLKEHLEAVNHAEALEYIRNIIRDKKLQITEYTILDIHKYILSKIDDTNAGRYRNVSVRIAGVPVVLPNPHKVPDLMTDFFSWLHTKTLDHPAKIAADAHLKLVTIHPFVDGNGRTARLLCNLILLQYGYPPALIRKEDRKKYLDSIAKAQLRGNLDDYYTIIYKAIDRSFDIYFETLHPSRNSKKVLFTKQKQFLRIGELAKETGETVPTIRHYTQLELLNVAEYTPKGYQLYDRSMIERVKEIRRMQKEEYLPLTEIKKIFMTRN